MDFSVSEKMQVILGMIREFIDKELIPLERQLEDKNFTESIPILKEKQEMVKKMELWAPLHPKDIGGMGLSLMENALVYEELGRTPLGLFVFGCQAPDAGNIEILHKHGNAEQKVKWLEPLVAGKIRSCFSMTEVDNPGSNPIMMDTIAVKDGDDYVINGHKWWTSAAEGANFAIAMVVTNPENPPHKRASMVIVPTDAPGFNIVRDIPVMGEKGDKFASHSEIIYQNCRVPQANLLGKEGDGFVIAQDRLGPGRIHHCMRWIGISNRAFDLMCARALSRTIAPGVKLADKEIIRMWIAESAAEIQAARTMILQTAWKIENFGAKEARVDIGLIKIFVPNVMLKVVDRALQVHGGLGMTDDTPIAKWYRVERAGRIYDGPDEAHKEAVARRILRQYKDKEVL
jgi:acyl-CoA dehydrogenase